ncbi:MAG TPA: serine/threonine protein kinase [Planctomycetaceae bacterium]|nr:serine/threonine protein kinase [Planctomycetaceae bacterium]
MANTVLTLFRRSAIASGLITKEQFDRAEAALRQEAELAGDDPKNFLNANLITYLTDQKMISEYQAKQLAKGMTKFTLGPYVITDWIGEGGMGQVFKAVHEVMGRESAVKVLPLTKSTPYAIENFKREIRTQAQLNHPNLVAAYDAGHDGNVHYLVTEFIPGTDLRRLVRSHGPLSMAQAASIIAQASRGLEHAHQRGLIHRDVKPGNILVTWDGIAKVSDLGLSGFIHQSEDDPRAGKIVGTADYLSPEQIHSPTEITAVADIYSLGCTLYYAVTGKVPFPGGKTRDKAQKHLHEQPLHPRKFNPDLSEEFVETIADMMEKSPEKRIPTADEVANRLEPWLTTPTTVPSYQTINSPWSLPPMPLEKERLHDTAEGSQEWNDNSRYSSGSESGGGAAQDTPTNDLGSTIPPPLLLAPTPAQSQWPLWIGAGLVLVAIALATGILIGYFLGRTV